MRLSLERAIAKFAPEVPLARVDNHVVLEDIGGGKFHATLFAHIGSLIGVSPLVGHPAHVADVPLLAVATAKRLLFAVDAEVGT